MSRSRSTLKGKFDLGGEKSENKMCVKLTFEGAYKFGDLLFLRNINCSPNLMKKGQVLTFRGEV